MAISVVKNSDSNANAVLASYSYVLKLSCFLLLAHYLHFSFRQLFSFINIKISRFCIFHSLFKLIQSIGVNLVR